MPNRRGAATQRVRVAAPNSDDDIVRQDRQRQAALRDARGRFMRVPEPPAWPVDPAPHVVLVGPNARVEPGDVFFRQETMGYETVEADHDIVVRNGNGETCLIFNHNQARVTIDRAPNGYEWRLINGPPQQFIGTRLEPARAELPLDPATGRPYTQEAYTAYRMERQRLRDIEVQEAQRLARERRHEADEKAEALLRAVLTEQEYASFCGGRLVAIKGSAGGDYQILREGLTSNIRYLVDGKHVRTFCVHPNTYDHLRNAYLPDADGYVAQILALRADEPGVLRETVVSWYADGWHPRERPLRGNRHHH